MDSDKPINNQQRLSHLRSSLMKLHKYLLEAERARYETTNGPIKNRGEFFQLVVSHSDFDWLRPISKFIVQIDELTSAKNPPADPEESAAILLEKGRLMMRPDENASTPLAANYFRAIQSDPAVALMNAELNSIFRKS